jgi:hypothetical protein
VNSRRCLPMMNIPSFEVSTRRGQSPIPSRLRQCCLGGA